MIRETAMVIIGDGEPYFLLTVITPNKTAEDVAKAKAESNDNIVRIECLCGKVLWERVIH